ncbi:hypothetical protein J7L05_06335, partial [bacterium]|nr:hypothetical protein [bacterium]
WKVIFFFTITNSIPTLVISTSLVPGDLAPLPESWVRQHPCFPSKIPIFPELTFFQVFQTSATQNSNKKPAYP